MNADRNHVFGFICVYRRSSAAHNPFSQRLSEPAYPTCLAIQSAISRNGLWPSISSSRFCALEPVIGKTARNLPEPFGLVRVPARRKERWGRGDASSEPIQSPANGASPAAATSAQAARVSRSDFINTSGVRGQG